MSKTLHCAWLAMAMLGCVCVHVQAEEHDSYFSGKTISIIVPTGPGGGYDTYARTLERHFGQHIAGHPSLSVQYVQGAGGLVAANNLYHLSKSDGTVIALLASSSLLLATLGEPLARFDNRQFNYIGNMSEETDTCSVWSSTSIQSTHDFVTQKVIIGTDGTGSNSQTFPMAMNDILHTQFDLVSGYTGSASLRTMAMERGEIQGTCGIFLSTMHAQFTPLLQTKKLRIVLQMGLSRHPELADVPNALELAQTEKDQQALRLLFAQLALGRPVLAPPHVPAQIVHILQHAFDETMVDPDYIADAHAMHIDTRWFNAQKMHEIVEAMEQTSEPIKNNVRHVLGIAQHAHP